MPERDWADARAKVEREARCRCCGAREGERLAGRIVRLEAAHVLDRSHDLAVGQHAYEGRVVPSVARGLSASVLWVDPDDVVALCGPFADSRSCHRCYDHHELDLLPHLTLPEQGAAARHVGLVRALRRTSPGAKL